MKIIILKIILYIKFLPPICNREKKKIRKSCSSLLGAKPNLRLFCWQAGIWSIMYVIEHVLHWNIIYIMFSNPSGMMYKNTMLVQLLKGHQKSSVDNSIYYHCRGRKIPFMFQALDDFSAPHFPMVFLFLFLIPYQSRSKPHVYLPFSFLQLPIHFFVSNPFL